jgi:pimeloyl-ACP methyl ester carboxylesterase
MPSVGVGDVELYYDAFGDGDEVVLLTPGLGAHATRYSDELCGAIAAAGYRVIRHDNRDVGLSTHLDDGSSYTLADMANDIVGLLDVLDVERVHAVGSSMGGMIVQQLAIDAPQRLWSLCSIMSTTGEPGVGLPHPEALEQLVALASPVEGRDEAIERAVALARVLASPAFFDEDEQRARQAAFYDRAYHPAGVARQLMAVLSSGDRAEGLRRLEVPALVIHGADDVLVGVDGGRRTAELIPGARYVEFPQMGHDLPRQLWPTYVELLCDHFRAACPRSGG